MWDSHRGKKTEDVEREFLALAIPIAQRLNYDVTDPDKGKREKNYKECMNNEMKDAKNDAQKQKQLKEELANMEKNK